MVYCMYSLELPHEDTQHTFMLKKIISLNYPCMEHIFMVPKVFKPLKFYCMYIMMCCQKIRLAFYINYEAKLKFGFNYVFLIINSYMLITLEILFVINFCKSSFSQIAVKEIRSFEFVILILILWVDKDHKKLFNFILFYTFVTVFTYLQTVACSRILKVLLRRKGLNFHREPLCYFYCCPHLSPGQPFNYRICCLRSSFPLKISV